MKVHRFPGFKSQFIFVNLGGHSWYPSVSDIENLCNLATKYKMTATDLCKIPYVQAENFEELKDKSEYVFLLSSDRSYSEEDIKCWGELFQELGRMPSDEYKLIICAPGIELKRVKRNLLVFM